MQKRDVIVKDQLLGSLELFIIFALFELVDRHALMHLADELIDLVLCRRDKVHLRVDADRAVKLRLNVWIEADLCNEVADCLIVV